MSERWTPTHCPHCGYDGAFDSMGPFTRKTATKRLGQDGTVEKWEAWDRMHCTDCGKQFAMLDKVVRIPYDEEGNEIEGERELVTDGGRETSGKYQIKRSCPHCEETGTSVVGQDEEVLICQNPACRVYSFARYHP